MRPLAIPAGFELATPRLGILAPRTHQGPIDRSIESTQICKWHGKRLTTMHASVGSCAIWPISAAFAQRPHTHTPLKNRHIKYATQPSLLSQHHVTPRQRNIPISEVERFVAGGDFATANHIRLGRYCVKTSDIDPLGNSDCIIEFDAEIVGRAIDLGCPSRASKTPRS